MIKLNVDIDFLKPYFENFIGGMDPLMGSNEASRIPNHYLSLPPKVSNVDA